MKSFQIYLCLCVLKEKYIFEVIIWKFEQEKVILVIIWDDFIP